ncbi:PRAME family member 12 [Heterocephalus glaber]|uniref:PRAME family member 12 n=1 Tax=Heterocephalus glaber TaxID=10181 RepID=G5BD99_HETGA|nr:PRAME family member 12 [Heterocephalus glaber]
MRTWFPPTLLDLAVQSLLRDKNLVIRALEELPRELFPPLSQLNIFRLPTWDLQFFQAVLDGLDVLLAQKVRPRRWKLQVLDMRNMHLNFWRVWAGNLEDLGSPEVTWRREMKKDGPKLAEKQPLRVLIDQDLCLECQDPSLHFLFKWVQERRGLVQLEWRKLYTDAAAPLTTVKFLEMVVFGCMEYVEGHRFWVLCIVCFFCFFLLVLFF